MIIYDYLCILLYVLGALPVYKIAEMVRNKNDHTISLVIVAATWPLVVLFGVARKVYHSLREQ